MDWTLIQILLALIGGIALGIAIGGHIGEARAVRALRPHIFRLLKPDPRLIADAFLKDPQTIELLRTWVRTAEVDYRGLQQQREDAFHRGDNATRHSLRQATTAAGRLFRRREAVLRNVLQLTEDGAYG